jgi:hypothetical protein
MANGSRDNLTAEEDVERNGFGAAIHGLRRRPFVGDAQGLSYDAKELLPELPGLKRGGRLNLYDVVGRHERGGMELLFVAKRCLAFDHNVAMATISTSWNV